MNEAKKQAKTKLRPEDALMLKQHLSALEAEHKLEIGKKTFSFGEGIKKYKANNEAKKKQKLAIKEE